MPTTFIPDELAIPKTFVPDGASSVPASFVPDSEFSNVSLPQAAPPPVVNAQAPLALPDVGPAPQQFGTTSNERGNAVPMSVVNTVQHGIGTGVAGVLNAFANVNAHRVGTDGQLINQPKPTFQLQFGKANPPPLEESVQPQQPPFEAGKYFGPAGLKLANEDIDPVNAALGGLLRSPFTPEGVLETPALMAGGAPAKAVMGLFGAGAGENLAKQGVSRLAAVMDSSQPSDVRKQAAVSLVSDIAMLAGGLHGMKGEAALEPSQQQYEQPLSQPRNVQQPQSFVPDATSPSIPQDITPSPTSSPVQNNEPVALKNMPVPSNDVVPPTEPVAPTTAPVQGVTPASGSSLSVTQDVPQQVPSPDDLKDVQHNLKNVAQTLKSNQGLQRLTTEEVAKFSTQGDNIFSQLMQDGNVEKANHNISQLQKEVTRKANSTNSSTPEDLTNYDAAQQQMKDAFASGDAGQLIKAFAANEAAKDKFGGMPPIERRQGYVPPTNAAESDGVSTAANSEQAEGGNSPTTSEAAGNQTSNTQRPVVESKAPSAFQEEGVDKGTASTTQPGNAGQRLGQQSGVADQSVMALTEKQNNSIAQALGKSKAVPSPVQLLNKTGSFGSESGALNGKIVQDLLDKVRKGLTPSDLAREVFNKDSLNAVRRGFMGHDVPHTLGHGEPLADELVKAAGAGTAGRLVGRSMVTDVLGNNAQDPQFRKQLGAALYEDQRKAYMRDNPSAQTTPVLDTKSSPFADEQQMQAFMKRQDVKDTIQRHVDTVQALAQEQHTKLGGKLAAVGKETGAFANLKAVLDDQETEQQAGVGKGQMATIKKGSAFNKERGFTGSDYDFDYRNIGERMVQRNYAEAAKQDFYNKVDSTGVGKIVEAGEKVPDGMVGVPIQRRVLTIVKPGEPSVWKSLNQTLAVPKDMAAEVRQAFQTDSPIQHSAVKLFNHVMTKVQVYAGVDAAAHVINDLSGVATAARSKLGQNIFPLGAVDTVSRLWNNGARVISNDAGIQREIADMAKNGVTFRIREGGGLSPVILRFADTVSRVTLNQIFEQGVKDGTFKNSADNRRTFINGQLGQYNPRLMGRVTQILQESGASPFIVAGKNFNKLGIKQTGLMSGVEATSIGEQAKVKLYKAAGLLSAGIAVPLLLNKHFTGSYTGTAGTKAGEIDFGKKDKQGNEIRYDMMKLLMLRRGMRVTGTEGLVEGQVMPRLRGEQPEPVGQSLKRGAIDAAKGVAGPYVGPAANATSTLFTGKSVLGYDNRQPGESFPYVKAAAKSANPLLGSGAEGYNKGSAKDAIAETFGKMAGLSYRNQSGVIRNLARTYTIQQGKGDDGSYAPSLYQPLVNAIKAGNPSTAQKQYDSLLQSKSQKEIETYFEKYANRPYTWSQQGDEAFEKTLTPQQQQLYQDTRDEDTSVAEKFFDTFSIKAFRAPKMRRPSRDTE